MKRTPPSPSARVKEVSGPPTENVHLVLFWGGGVGGRPKHRGPAPLQMHQGPRPQIEESCLFAYTCVACKFVPLRVSGRTGVLGRITYPCSHDRTPRCGGGFLRTHHACDISAMKM